MAKVIKIGKKKIKNQFVLISGDDGAILIHYDGGKLINRLFIDSPFSGDVALMEKLLKTYANSPISLLVDNAEQNYSQQILPPVSSFTINQQVQKKIKRDFQPNDFNNYISLGRSQEGRKDWQFLFVSLANAEPFSKWLEILLNQPNDFKGVFLLPIESQRLTRDLNLTLPEYKPKEWEIMVLHNKTGGFRIVSYRKGKILFTRLTQQFVGDNVAEVIVGTMEQEIQNTVEYLKRLGFRNDSESRITIVAGAEIISKLEKNNIKFGDIYAYTPYQASLKLGLDGALGEKDKYADVLSASHFASQSKPLLKFDSPFTKKITNFYLAIKSLVAGAALLSLLMLAMAGNEVYSIVQLHEQLDAAESARKAAVVKRNQAMQEQEKLNQDKRYRERMIDVMQIYLAQPLKENQVSDIIRKIGSSFGDNVNVPGLTKVMIKKVTMDVKGLPSGERDSAPAPTQLDFIMKIDFQVTVPELEQDFAPERSKLFVNQLKTKFADSNYTFDLTNVPAPQASGQGQVVNLNTETAAQAPEVTLTGVIEVKGKIK